ACFSAGKGREVVLFEKQKKIGRKVLVTGNGRCNIANRNVSADHYHGNNPRFVNNLFSRFGLGDTIEFFESIGLPLTEEKNGRLYPASLQASSVVKILGYEIERRGVEVRLQRKIDRIEPSGSSFMVMTAGKEEHRFDSVILAAGSCACPPAGGSRDGYDLARAFGHTVREPFPAILPLNVPLKILHRLQGVKWDCGIKAVRNGRTAAESQGELLFTAYGISGPAALDISRAVNDPGEDQCRIVIDVFPTRSERELGDLLDALWEDGSKTLSLSLIGVLKGVMPDVIPRIAGIDPGKRVRDLSPAEKTMLARVMKGLELEPGRPRGFNEAVVAAGGVNVDEIDPATMESRLIAGLHITGELLDMDGISGGYNLQFAWSSGAVAGMAQGTFRSS
ncbi:MAG: NAD(P)/FAD-dependent oxidoreductase, partial [Chrysiogenales bacterium]